MLDSKSYISKERHFKIFSTPNTAVRYLFHVPPKEALLEKLSSPPLISTTATKNHAFYSSLKCAWRQANDHFGGGALCIVMLKGCIKQENGSVVFRRQ